MVVRRKNETMAKLAPERKRKIIEELQYFFEEEFEEELSSLQAELLLGFVLEQIGPTVYHQAIQDARIFFQERVDDLEAVLYVE